ncbi:josephin-like protein [Pyrus ussuriensis x Pyrus communis]|uniref:ubiquitinyl hydrolase 1 n=1 Tax=Pyrus ussuriensis x Pyrus communis TaxID=2448454 RepID=A0A5N5GMY8_9ROSA|nr:josephin-like protein [Pyrus ussuriensis x Pyrus communis]
MHSLGNYDINVLMATSEDKGKNVVWHDRQNGASSIDLDRPGDAGLMGVLLNVPVRMFAGVWKSKHWVTLRKIDGVRYNLDSDLFAPEAFEDTEKG